MLICYEPKVRYKLSKRDLLCKLFKLKQTFKPIESRWSPS